MSGTESHDRLLYKISNPQLSKGGKKTPRGGGGGGGGPVANAPPKKPGHSVGQSHSFSEDTATVLNSLIDLVKIQPKCWIFSLI